MDSIVIRIRYLDLSAALDGTAVTAGRSTTVYLRPGLTGPQRSAALRRMRQEARVGRGPRLPCGQLAVALAADRVRSSAGRALAVVRLHPAIALLPSILLGATAGLLLMAAMSKGVPRHHHEPAAVSPALVARLIGGSVPLGPPRRLPPRRLLTERAKRYEPRRINEARERRMERAALQALGNAMPGRARRYEAPQDTGRATHDLWRW